MKKEINIRLNANRAKVVNTGYKFSSGDKGIVFKIAVDELDTTGTTAKIVFKRSNGTSVESNITAAENVYSYTTLGNEFAVVGPVVADVKFYEGENRVSTSTFIFEVTSDTMDGIGAGTAGYSDTLEQMKESMMQAQEGMNATKGEMETLSSQLETLYDSYAEAFGTTGAFNPKGNYSAEESYTVRDLVSYIGGMWICNKNCTVATPGPDSDCWQYFFSHAEIEAIITGTQQVGNAKTLDGHGAEEFAPLADLANYFPKSGGTINGDVGLYKENDALLYMMLKNALRQINLEVQKGGAFRLRDTTNRKDIINSTVDGTNTFNGTASGNLPLTGGGTVTSNSYQIFEIKNINSNGSSAYIRCSKSDDKLGFIGFNGKNVPGWKTADETKNYDFLHTGNKPTGSYTGNGDGERRVFETGGIGNMIVIYSELGTVIVFRKGAIYIDGVSNGSEIRWWANSNIYCIDGMFTFATTNALLNQSGMTYYWEVH